jgi:hypothetical protein
MAGVVTGSFSSDREEGQRTLALAQQVEQIVQHRFAAGVGLRLAAKAQPGPGPLAAARSGAAGRSVVSARPAPSPRPLPAPVSADAVAAQRVERRSGATTAACRSSSARPLTRQRPCTVSTARPSADSRSVPPGRSVLKGAPSPGQPGRRPVAERRAAGRQRQLQAAHAGFDAQPHLVVDAALVPQPQFHAASGPRAPGQRSSFSRPGKALASRLPGPPASTATALPDHTLPRASASSRRWPLASAMARPASVPAQRPPRPAARRPRHHPRPRAAHGGGRCGSRG